MHTNTHLTSLLMRMSVFAAVAVAAFGVVPTALAGGTNTYRETAFTCQYAGGQWTSGNVIRASPPLMTSYIADTFSLANVSWKPTVYRWTNGQWVVFRTTHWIDGAANGNTSSGTWEENFHAFQNIPSGYYRVHNDYWWESNGARAMSWAPYSRGGYYCRF